MRTVWASHVDVDGESLARARAALRYAVRNRWGPECDDVGVHRFADGVTVSVAELHDDAAGDRVRVISRVGDHPQDPSVSDEVRIAVGTDHGRGFLWCRHSLASRTPALVGTVAFAAAPPKVFTDTLTVAPGSDGGHPFGVAPEPFDLETLQALLSAPGRRFPVVGVTAAAGLDRIDLARRLAGLAHVVDLGRRVAECPAELDIGISAAVTWWPGWPATPVLRHSADELVDYWGAGYPLLRTFAAASAFRIPQPPVIDRLERAAARRRIADTLAAQQPAADSAAPSLEGVAFDEWEADLVALDAAVARAEEAEARAASVSADNAALLAAWDDTVDAAVAARSRPEEAPSFSSVSEVLAWAEEHLERIDVSPEAHRAGADSPYRWPDRLAGALQTLDVLAKRWADDDLPSGFTGAAIEAGLPWRSDIGEIAASRYTEDYTATLPSGDRVVCGPHLGWGANTGPAGHLRCYLYLDRDRRRVVVGPTGRHGRGATNR